MSRSDAQLRTFSMLWDELLPHVATDRNLPTRIQQRLAKEKRFGSRDRRLYRELLYTALRYMPWLENEANETDFPREQATLWLASDTPATTPLKRELLAQWPACPPTLAERATILKQTPATLLPAWFKEHCPLAFEAPHIDALHTRAPLWLRLQTDNPAPVFAEFTARGWTWRTTNAAPDAIELLAANETDITKTESYERGLFEIQDLGSQLILHTARARILNLKSHISNPANGGHWLDACAGAGGKTLQLARILATLPEATIDAADPRPEALTELRARAARAGIKNIRTLHNSQTAFQNPHSYDGILIDAPCSGTGTWRRSPHLKYCLKETAVQTAATRQLSILTRHAPLVRKDGGLLIYATCSLSRHENEDIITAFLGAPEHRDFTLEQQTTILPATHNTDGFYTATLRRAG